VEAVGVGVKVPRRRRPLAWAVEGTCQQGKVVMWRGTRDEGTWTVASRRAKCASQGFD